MPSARDQSGPPCPHCTSARQASSPGALSARCSRTLAPHWPGRFLSERALSTLLSHACPALAWMFPSRSTAWLGSKLHSFQCKILLKNAMARGRLVIFALSKNPVNRHGRAVPSVVVVGACGRRRCLRSSPEPSVVAALAGLAEGQTLKTTHGKKLVGKQQEREFTRVPTSHDDSHEFHTSSHVYQRVMMFPTSFTRVHTCTNES